MPKGTELPVGSETINQKGYTSVKTETGWKSKHIIIAERNLGRLIDKETERVLFRDRDRTNFDPDNIEVVTKKETAYDRTSSLRTRLLRAERQVEKLRGLLDDIQRDIDGQRVALSSLNPSLSKPNEEVPMEDPNS